LHSSLLLNKKQVHNLILLELTSLGPVVTKLQIYKKKQAHKLVVATPKSNYYKLETKKMLHTSLMLNKKASVETWCCHNLEIWAWLSQSCKLAIKSKRRNLLLPHPSLTSTTTNIEQKVFAYKLATTTTYKPRFKCCKP
jgi:hypothetical protein